MYDQTSMFGRQFGQFPKCSAEQFITKCIKIIDFNSIIAKKFTNHYKSLTFHRVDASTDFGVTLFKKGRQLKRIGFILSTLWNVDDLWWLVNFFSKIKKMEKSCFLGQYNFSNVRPNVRSNWQMFGVWPNTKIICSVVH